jgi:hypothetical protein
VHKSNEQERRWESHERSESLRCAIDSVIQLFYDRPCLWSMKKLGHELGIHLASFCCNPGNRRYLFQKFPIKMIF